MKKLHLLLCMCFFIASKLKSQELFFGGDSLLTKILVNTNAFSDPLIPWDYNNDNRVDFFGITGKNFMKANENGYELASLNAVFLGLPIRTIDFDKNGTLDYVNTSGILFNNGAKYYKHPKNNELILDVADFDGDGLNDYITGFYNFTFKEGNLTIWYNNGDNTFKDFVINNSFFCEHVAVKDIDNDGLPDIIATGLDEKDIYYMKPDRTYKAGGFSFFIDFDDHTLSPMDIDGDLDQDLVVYRINYGFSSLNYNNASYGNNFKSSRICQSVATFRNDDLNGDGRDEIIFLYSNQGILTVAYLQIDDQFNFSEIKDLGSFGSYPDSYTKEVGNAMKNNLSIYDLDQDGKKEIIFSNGFDKSIYFFKNLTPVGTEETPQFAKAQLLVYPNPCSDLLNIVPIPDLQIAEFDIYDSNGQLFVNKCQFDQSQIDLGMLNPGVYIMKIKNTEKTMEVQFVKR